MKFFPAIILLISFNIFAQDTDIISTDTTKLKTISNEGILSQDTTKPGIKDTIAIIKPFYPLYQNPLYVKSFFISRYKIDVLDYRYTGDFFLPVGFSFLKDRGLPGQLNELVLYGSGSGNISFLSDGILYNNRLTDRLDLNFIQSELIDSIEIIPLPRGAVYGPDNYTTTVNFLEKDFLTGTPYTRIKYYEGPEGEAFVDGIFNTSIMNKFNLMFDVTNRKFDGTYTNSDFSIWQAKIKLKYLLSNNINISGFYSFVSSEVGLNGGVDVDSISKITNDINSVLYEPLQAPVVFPTLRRKAGWDKFKIRVLGRFGSYDSDLNFYYHSETEKYSGIPSNDEIKNHIIGASLKQSYSLNNLKLELNGVYENRELNYYFNDTTLGFIGSKNDYDILAITPIFSIYFLDSTLIPSVFYKYSNASDNSGTNHVTGADVNFRILSNLNLYLGASKISDNSETNTYELGVKIMFNNFSADIRYYRQDSDNQDVDYVLPAVLPIFSPIQYRDLNGISASLVLDVWKIRLEEKINYNSFEESQASVSSDVKLHINSGIFYKDILFNRNLDLKTGFTTKYYDFESEDFESAWQIDFTVAGIIQKVAIVYFSWENLLEEKYFIVPYYPMKERGIRFGLAWELFN